MSQTEEDGVPRQKDKYVQGYTYWCEGDPRHETICQIVGRCTTEGELLNGPCFLVEFGDGSTVLAHDFELRPWFPVG